MNILTEPYFWAFFSMFGLVGCGAVVSGSKLGQHPYFGMLVVTIFDLGRFLLVLPMCDQPRFDLGWFQTFAGLLMFIVGLVFCSPAFRISPFTAASSNPISLKTDGLYALVRNPIYTGELLWSLGWAILFGSVVGVALIPFWWLALLFHIAKEEECLTRELGVEYQDYMKTVRGRMIPGLPI